MYPNFYKTLGIETWLGEMQVVDALGGKEKARPFLEEHWDTWVTKQDLQNLKDGGITHIRIPIGYWILGEEFLKPGETYLPGAWPYLLRSLKWCKELGLKAIVDLHGAPGVQNGEYFCSKKKEKCVALIDLSLVCHHLYFSAICYRSRQRRL